MSKWWEYIKWLTGKTFFKQKKNRIERYAVPLIFVVLILLAKSFLHLFISSTTSYHLLLLPVILSAWYGGLGPGIFATFVIAVLDDFLFLPPTLSLMSIDSTLLTGIFILEGILISIISEAVMQANRQKDEFIGFASHELKNPLAAIQAFSEMLQRKINNKQLKHYIDRVHGQSVKATNLINDLLDLTKIEAGKFIYNDEKFSIYNLLQEIIQDLRMINNTHRIMLSGKSKKIIYGDRYRIGQVILNLLTNAIKYSPNAKRVIVTIANKKGIVIISVRDYGMGIDKKYQNKIFDRFFRTNKAENDKIQGLGLGLYISAQIVKRHNGKLLVESIEGKGATFQLQLPVLR